MFVDRRKFLAVMAGTPVFKLYPQYAIPGRYIDLCAKYAQLLVDSENYNWFIACSPRTQADSTGTTDPSVLAGATSTAGAGSPNTVEDNFTVVPGSMLWGLTSFSTQPEGFKFEIWDMGHTNRVSIVQSLNGVLSGDINVSTFGAPSPFIFDKPYPITGTGQVSIKISNLSPVANAVQLAMHMAQPKQRMESKCRQ